MYSNSHFNQDKDRVASVRESVQVLGQSWNQAEDGGSQALPI